MKFPWDAQCSRSGQGYEKTPYKDKAALGRFIVYYLFSCFQCL
ncbi:hypothetical protein VCRA217O17_60070 [Vibrio crassostreae]|nr:hypothetical protein VCRA212O16_10087 [Vibrio crassostreae]CAK3941231.1 hypothetical protein VCRA217O17_60070 [Vibrio crassostreae]